MQDSNPHASSRMRSLEGLEGPTASRNLVAAIFRQTDRQTALYTTVNGAGTLKPLVHAGSNRGCEQRGPASK